MAVRSDRLIENAAVDLFSVDKGSAGGVLIDQQIRVVFKDDLSMESRETLLMEDNIIVKLASQSRYPFYDGHHLLIDDQKSTVLARSMGVRNPVFGHTGY